MKISKKFMLLLAFASFVDIAASQAIVMRCPSQRTIKYDTDKYVGLSFSGDPTYSQRQFQTSTQPDDDNLKFMYNSVVASKTNDALICAYQVKDRVNYEQFFLNKVESPEIKKIYDECEPNENQGAFTCTEVEKEK